MIRNPEIRRHDLISFLGGRKFHRIEDILKNCGVSKATLHRDLDKMERAGLVKKTYGCVEVIQEELVETQYSKRITRNAAAKAAIAKEAFKLVSAGDFIFIDASSTCYYLAKTLCSRPCGSLKMASNSVHILSLLPRTRGKIEFISTGGLADFDLNAFAGPFALENIAKMNFHKAFVSGAGFSLGKGISTTSAELLSVLEAAIENSSEKYCLVDSGKFNRDCPFRAAALQDFDAVLSDEGYQPGEVEKFREKGVNFITAPP